MRRTTASGPPSSTSAAADVIALPSARRLADILPTSTAATSAPDAEDADDDEGTGPRWLELTDRSQFAEGDDIRGLVSVAYALADEPRRKVGAREVIDALLQVHSEVPAGKHRAPRPDADGLGLGFLSNTAPTLSICTRLPRKDVCSAGDRSANARAQEAAWQVCRCMQDPAYLKTGARASAGGGEAGVTGAVVWRTTPLCLRFLAQEDWFLAFCAGSVPGSRGETRREGTTAVVELGCGVAGLTPRVLTPGRVLDAREGDRRVWYVLTDHDLRLLKLARQNVALGSAIVHGSAADAAALADAADLPRTAGPSSQSDRNDAQIDYLQLDWTDRPLSCASRQLRDLLDARAGDASAGERVDRVVLLALDCVYNGTLAVAFNGMLRRLLDVLRRPTGSSSTIDGGTEREVIAIVGQQCREEELHADWLADLCGHESGLHSGDRGHLGANAPEDDNVALDVWQFDAQSCSLEDLSQPDQSSAGGGVLPIGFNVYVAKCRQ